MRVSLITLLSLGVSQACPAMIVPNSQKGSFRFKPDLFSCWFTPVKVILHGTIRNEDFERNTALQFWNNREIKIHVYAKRETWICTTWPSFFLNCRLLLLLLLKNKYFHASFIHKNCSGQFLFSYFLFWEILNLNPTLAVRRKGES